MIVLRSLYLALQKLVTDGLIEAFATNQKNEPVLGIQWHPERQNEFI
jgi:gamma-glutamyl-gamma-aminobutyrate hydrolase PuuD